MALGARSFAPAKPSSSRLVYEMLGAEHRARYAPDETDHRRPIRDYAELIPESNLGPLRLDAFPFQIEAFYDDEIADAEEVVYMKSAQVGASTGLWRWCVRRVDQFGESAIYFFPTEKHVTDFGDERIEPSIEASEYLRRRMPVGGSRRKTLKQIGAGTLSLRGIASKSAVQSVAAQAIVFDEYDLSDPGNIAQAERRISGAKQLGLVPRIRRAGYPSIEGYGIDAAFQESDRRLWMVRCPDCGHEQDISFTENLRWRSAAGGGRILRAGRDDYESKRDVIDVWRACRSCEASLEGAPLLEGRWTPTASGPGRVPGFHITRLLVATTDLHQLVRASRETKISEVETFYNNDLGIAFTPEGSALSDEDLDRASAAGLPVQEGYTGRYPVTMGLDVASERDLSCRISEHLPNGIRRALKIWEPATFDEVLEALHAFKVTVAVIDSLPERRIARGLANELPGRVFLGIYDERHDADAWRYDEKKKLVHINRTEAMDAMMDSIRHASNVPNRPAPPHYFDQMKAPKRRIVEDTKGRPRRVYVATGQHGDDYAHAEVYDLVASELLTAMNLAGVAIEEGEGAFVTEEPEAVRLGWGEMGYRPGFQGQG